MVTTDGPSLEMDSPDRAPLSLTDRANAELREILAQKVSVELDGVELAEILRFFRDTYGISIRYPLPGVPDNGLRPSKHIVPAIRQRDTPLERVLRAITQSVGLTYRIVSGHVLVGTERELDALTQTTAAPWPALETLRVSDSFEGEHVGTVLDRWGKELGVYFHLDPFFVGPEVNAGGPPYETDGYLGAIQLKEVSLSAALDEILTPLGLAYWYGQPLGLPVSLHPSVWISTPRVLAQIAAGESPQFKIDVSLVELGETARQEITKIFPPLPSDGPSAIVTFPIPQSASLSDQGVTEAFRKPLEKSPHIAAEMELLSAPRVTTIAGNSWWPNSAKQAQIVATSAGDEGKGILRMKTHAWGGVVHLPPGKPRADWNPFDGTGCGSRHREVPPSIKLHCDDALIPEATDFLATYSYPAVIMDMAEVYTPPLPGNRPPVAKRAGRRGDTAPGPSSASPDEVRLHHEGVLVGVQTLDYGESIRIRLFSQYRPSGAGPIPWEGFLMNYKTYSGDIMGFMLPTKRAAKYQLLVVRATRV